MSRIGKLPVQVPGGVQVALAADSIKVKGPKGEISRAVPAGIALKQEGGSILVQRIGEDRQARANHGLMRTHVKNMVTGVTTGFERKLDIQGTGYKAEVKGKTLVMSLGFSHPVEYPFPAGITIEATKDNGLIVRGVDKDAVGQVAAELRSKRPPDSYKGKGVRFNGEYVRIKAGKTAQ